MNMTIKTIRTGISEALPLAIAIAAYGLSYGVLGIQAGFGLLGTVLMSLLVFSGSVQMVTVAMITGGAGILSILVTATLLNLRNLLYGAALAEGIAPAKRWRWLLSFGVSDEPFVLGISRFKQYGPDPIYFATVAGTFYIAWVSSSLIGAIIGNQIIDPQKWGLDLAFPITFVALLVPNLTEKPIIATALTGAVITVILTVLFPGTPLNILVAGVLAPLVGIYLKEKNKNVD
ncbi:4-azaleucine resistance transporter AzlC [Anoxybacillus voinovskiensis]|uniref:4-azaleucine resistance transporter AzlC n=1 Tax=Anoxybacteroides voinovskiense TaxID=230470 RepID=A0A840DQT4_9BACL|nr:AzlC family ABC transporter permease [Anoxybacillus voinovskiensis]MBB4075370.1 4-azaleucine resistance transporter AzlC [Anoxybacillus voinovskiensis]GGJ78427.1 branched-chain amino acid ABC transporter permease [Anoxybacillus voinovskiensis]